MKTTFLYAEQLNRGAGEEARTNLHPVPGTRPDEGQQGARLLGRFAQVNPLYERQGNILCIILWWGGGVFFRGKMKYGGATNYHEKE